MDETLLRRVQAVGATLIAIAYFLPWASIMSPLGSIELRGLYVDYAWILLILAIVHLLLQFAMVNKNSLGLPASALNYMELIWRIVPFVLGAFLVWYGASFGFSAHNASSDGHASVFGTSVESVVKASLDYGYWIGTCGVALLIASVGLLSKQGWKFVDYAAVVIIATVGLAFGFSRPGKQVRPTAMSASMEGAASRAGTTGNASSVTNPAESDFDSSPYIQFSSISATPLVKDYEAHRYSDSIIISPIFRNVGSKTVVGLRGHLAVMDGFGKEVYEFNFRNDDRILPGNDSGRGGYSFEENQFDDNNPYHKMLPLIEAGTAKYNVRITNIAFDDGTVLPK